MIICSCNAISDTSVRASVNSEKCPRTPGAVYRCLGCRPCCGRCFKTVRQIIDDALGQPAAAMPVEASIEAFRPAARHDDHLHMHDSHVEADACAGCCADCAAAA